MGLLSNALRGIRVLTQNGVAAPSRTTLEMPDVTFTDDPANDRTIGRISGPNVNPTFGAVTASSLSVGAWTVAPQPQIPTTGDATASLFASALTIGTRQDLKIRCTIRASIFGQTAIPSLEVVGEANLVRLSGSPSLTWKSAVSAESNVACPWSGLVSSPSVNVTGAADNGSGLIRLTIDSSQGMSAGSTTVNVQGIVGTGGLAAAANKVWIVDAVPDGTHIDLRGSSFTGGYTSGGTVTPGGSMSFQLVGNALQLAANGLTGAAWLQSENILLYSLRTTPGGLYLCTTPGTTAGSGTGPSGSGAGINDNGVKWERLSTGTDATIYWQATPETYLIQG